MMKIFLLVLAHVLVGESVTIDDEVYLNLVTTITNLQQQVLELKDLPNKIAQLQLKRCKTQNSDALGVDIAEMAKLEMAQDQLPEAILQRLENLKKEYQRNTDAPKKLDGKFLEFNRMLPEKMRNDMWYVRDENFPTTPAPVTTPAPKLYSEGCVQGQGYKLFTEAGRIYRPLGNIDYHEAKRRCQSYGTHLPYVNMKTVDERRNVIESLGMSDKTLFWIGLTDRKEEDVWRWEDGTIANKSTVGFSAGEPTGIGEGYLERKEDCVHTWPNFPDFPSLTHLNDLRCSYPLQDVANLMGDDLGWPVYETVILCEYDNDCEELLIS